MTCPVCNGTGKDPRGGGCFNCGGTGKVASAAWESEPGHDLGNVETGRSVCPCGVDHPDPSTGLTGEAKIAKMREPGYWTPIEDPRAQAALDDLYAEAWLDD